LVPQAAKRPRVVIRRRMETAGSGMPPAVTPF